ncbi:hypothetical protein PO909_015321, partial [Leuciscus waleckii]
VAHQSTSSVWLPRPPGSTLVVCLPALASGLHSSGFALSLRPSGSIGLLTPSSSTLVLCRSGSTAAFWIPACVAVKKLTCGTLLPLSTTAHVHLLLPEPANFIVWNYVYQGG